MLEVKRGPYAGYEVTFLGYFKKGKISVLSHEDSGCDCGDCEDDDQFLDLPPTAFGYKTVEEFHKARTVELTTALMAERKSYAMAGLKRPSKAKQKEILECIKV